MCNSPGWPTVASKPASVHVGHEDRIAQLEHALAEATAELQDRQARTKQVLDTANDAFLTADIAGRVTDWNTPAEQLFGWPAEEALGQTLDTFLIPLHAAADPDSPLSAVLDACGDRSRGELLAHHRDGRSFPVEVSISLMVDEDRFVFNAFVHDITERQAMTQRLMQSQKLESIGQLAAGIAHEINTPTQYVGDNVEFLRDSFHDLAQVFDAQAGLVAALQKQASDFNLPEPIAAALAQLQAVEYEADLAFIREEVPAAVEQAAEGVRRVAAIVKSMKAFSHPGGSAASHAAMSAIDLNEAVADTLTVCRSEWKYVAKLTTDFADDLPAVTCFPGELNQVVLNIVVNAAQALAEQRTPANATHPNTAATEPPLGLITVATRRDGPDHVAITLTDNAGGIPHDIQPRIFDPFFTTKQVGQGTGQGLAIAHRVVTEQHQGTLDFQSTPGQGTTFHIRLPVRPAQPVTTDQATNLPIDSDTDSDTDARPTGAAA